MLYFVLLSFILNLSRNPVARKIRTIVGVVNGTSLTSIAALRHTSDERNITVNARHVMGSLAQTQEPTDGENSDPDRNSQGDGSKEWLPGGKFEKGRCCKKKRMGEKLYRWFIWEEDGSIQANDCGRPKCQCPSKWWTVDNYYCSQFNAEVWNQYKYEDSTDWVMCCKQQPDKSEYKYYTGGDCEENTATFNCKSYDCKWHLNVNEKDITCDPGYTKYTNEGAKYCKDSNKGMNSADCAGYPAHCATAYCYSYSHSRNTDCRDKCAGWENASKANPERPKVGYASDKNKEESGSYERSEGFPMIGYIGIGAFVLVAGGIGAYMAMNKGGGSSSGNLKGGIPQDDVMEHMPPKGKGKGKGYDQMGGPPAGSPYDYGGHPPNTGPAACMQQPPQFPPSWGVVPGPAPYSY
mmetsp:Transcript_39581/g.62870  ORF Transcript_39581/g.62870 Transcript_39581/m.62870 type:complete len:408 (-) Transcript_39581:217-1440(-)